MGENSQLEGIIDLNSIKKKEKEGEIEKKLLMDKARDINKKISDKLSEETKEFNRYSKQLKKFLEPEFFAEKLLDFKPYEYQLKILRDQKDRVIVKSGRQIGKTTITSIKALHYAFTNAEKTVLVIAPTQRQSSNLFNKIRDFAQKHALLRKSIVRHTQTMIEFTNKSRIYALPSGYDGSGIRGYTADLMIIDEAAFIPEEVFPAILPMLATTKGQLVLLSTPFGRRGFFYDCWKDKKYSKHDYPSSVSPLISDSFLKDQKAKLTDIEYRTEYLAEFVDEAGSYFPMSLINKCIRDYSILNQGEIGKTYFAGIDWAKYQDSTVIAVVERGEDYHRIVHLKEFKGVPYEVSISYFKSLLSRFNILRVYADRGAGERQIEEIRSLGVNVVPLYFTTTSKIDIYQNLKFLMENEIIHIPSPEIKETKTLINQLADFTYNLSPHGNLIFTKGKKEHDDYVDALALACFNLKRPYRPIIFFGKSKN